MNTPRVPVPTRLLAAIAAPLLLFIGITSMPLGATTVSSAGHDLYSPARTALLNAQRQVAESLGQEREILERLRQMHGALDSSLALLANAEELDPSMKSRIEAVRNRLAALQDKPALCPQDKNSSLDVYSQLLGDLQALIEHY